MSSSNEASKSQLEFENLLQQAKKLTLTKLSSLSSSASLSGAEFEKLVCAQVEKAAIGTIFENKVKPTLDRVFPDIIVADTFGIEVKATKKDDWASIGNSVLESSRDAAVDKIYIFFGKLGGDPDIIYRDYESSLKGIAVTHYPRYQINMKLPEGESIFDLMGTSYSDIRQSKNPVGIIREYYKSKRNGQTLWWIDDGSDEVRGLNPIIQYFSLLDDEKKESLKAEAFILFPEILSMRKNKFENLAAYWISKYGVISPNLRDNFSASGRVKITYKGTTYSVPRIIQKFIGLADLIDRQIHEADDVDVSQWKKDIDKKSEKVKLPIKASLIFEAALADDI